MPIHVSEPPSEGRELVRQSLVRRQQGMIALAFDGADPQLTVSFPIYTGTGASLLEGNFLESARETAWLYVIGSSDSPQGLAEMSTKGQHGEARLKYASRYPGELAEEILNVIADAHAVVNDGAQYELRILRAPALSLLAVWLSGDRHLIFLVRSTSAIEDRHVVTEEELVEALRPLAQQRMTASDLPAGNQ
jgi:hypothetical protein